VRAVRRVIVGTEEGAEIAAAIALHAAQEDTGDPNAASASGWTTRRWNNTRDAASGQVTIAGEANRASPIDDRRTASVHPQPPASWRSASGVKTAPASRSAAWHMAGSSPSRASLKRRNMSGSARRSSGAQGL